MEKSPVYAELNKKWKGTCRILFGEGIGELEEYKEWLSEMGHSQPLLHKKSSLSGNDITCAVGDYSKSAKFIGFSEIDFFKKHPPLSINDIKDIDSVLDAVRERVYYTGDMILGNSKFVEKSSNVSDSFFVWDSAKIGDSKYIAHSESGRLCECVFGTSFPGESSFLVRCNDTYRCIRCFELWMSVGCSDCYYVFNTTNCTDCFFSFSIRGKRHAIGNLELPPEKYRGLKQKLLCEMKDELKKKKRLPSLAEIVGKCKNHTAELKPLLKVAPAGRKADMAPVERAFTEATKLILGMPLSGLENYAVWLKRHLRETALLKSEISGKSVFSGGYANYGLLPKERAVTEEEALALAETAKPSEEEIGGITLKEAHNLIEKIAYFTFDYHDGINENVVECMAYAQSRNCYRCAPCVEIKNSAYNYWPRSSDYVFGCGTLFDSSFCINCYNSVNLKRCFEVDSLQNCSESYFCHNCENVQNALFCFNVKNIRYAVGNAEVGREKFQEAKEALLAWVGRELERKRGLELDIYNLAFRQAD